MRLGLAKPSKSSQALGSSRNGPCGGFYLFFNLIRVNDMLFVLIL